MFKKYYDACIDISLDGGCTHAWIMKGHSKWAAVRRKKKNQHGKSFQSVDVYGWAYQYKLSLLNKN